MHTKDADLGALYMLTKQTTSSGAARKIWDDHPNFPIGGSCNLIKKLWHIIDFSMTLVLAVARVSL